MHKIQYYENKSGKPVSDKRNLFISPVIILKNSTEMILNRVIYVA